MRKIISNIIIISIYNMFILKMSFEVFQSIAIQIISEKEWIPSYYLQHIFLILIANSNYSPISFLIHSMLLCWTSIFILHYSYSKKIFHTMLFMTMSHIVLYTTMLFTFYYYPPVASINTLREINPKAIYTSKIGINENIVLIVSYFLGIIFLVNMIYAIKKVKNN